MHLAYFYHRLTNVCVYILCVEVNIASRPLSDYITQLLLKVTIFGKHHSKLDNVPQDSVRKVIVDDRTGTTHEDIFDICVESSGSAGGIMMAAGANDFNTAPFVVKEITLIGSHCGNFEMALFTLLSHCSWPAIQQITYPINIICTFIPVLYQFWYDWKSIITLLNHLKFLM